MGKDRLEINRRKFLKILGIGAASTSIVSCISTNELKDDLQVNEERTIKGSMTYRINPKTKEKVSLLGYGCMRLPNNAEKNEIDQEKFKFFIRFR